MTKPQAPIGRMGALAESELDRRLQDLLDYWRAKRGIRKYPARADIDPLDLRAVLGNINLVDVVLQADGTKRFRYRLFGTDFVFYHGADLTGRWIDDVPNPDFRAELVGMYAGVADSGEPRLLTYDYIYESRRHRFQAVILPLSANGTDVDMILAGGMPVAVY